MYLNVGQLKNALQTYPKDWNVVYKYKYPDTGEKLKIAIAGITAVTADKCVDLIGIKYDLAKNQTGLNARDISDILNKFPDSWEVCLGYNYSSNLNAYGELCLSVDSVDSKNNIVRFKGSLLSD